MPRPSSPARCCRSMAAGARSDQSMIRNNSVQSVAASLAVATVGAGWGVYWLPLRQLEARGFNGEWATACLFIACLPAVLPLGLMARRELTAHGSSLIGLALGNGAAF